MSTNLGFLLDPSLSTGVYIVAASCAGLLAYKLISMTKGKASIPDSAPEKLTVYGWMPIKNGPDPDSSPACVKVLTFLKIAKVDYEYKSIGKHMMKGSPKAYIPFVRGGGFFNGQYQGESQLIIEGIMKDPKFNVDSWLSKEDKAIGNAFRTMVEEEIYWPGGYVRWCTDQYKKVTVPTYFGGGGFVPKPLIPLVAWISRDGQVKRLHQQGTGRLTAAEMKIKVERALSALSTFLASKKYLLGDRVSSFDAAIYGYLTLIIQGDWKHEIKDGVHEYSNIVAYVDRMRSEFWPERQP